MDFPVLFEDSETLVVLKTAGLPSQPDKTGDPDLQSEVLKYLNKGSYLAIINRLDRPVGGIVLFAKTTGAAAKLSKAMLEGNIKKEYLAVLVGSLPKKEGSLIDYLRKNGKTNLSCVVQKGSAGAKEARLDYCILEEIETEVGLLSLAQIKLLTGRHHQIRVQMSNSGAGIFADKKYNAKNEKASPGNVALWAYSLAFPLPKTNEIITLCQYPKDYPFCLFKERE